MAGLIFLDSLDFTNYRNVSSVKQTNHPEPMKTFILCVLALMLANSASAQTNKGGIRDNIFRHCQSEWPTDFSMQAYCEELQWDGANELLRLVESNGGIPPDDFNIAMGGCALDWDTDYTMIAYCMNRQIEGYNAVHRRRGIKMNPYPTPIR